MNDYETLFRFEHTKYGIVFTDEDGNTDCIDPEHSITAINQTTMNYSFTNYETGVVFNLTSDDILNLWKTLKIGTDELAEMLTGLTVDSYSDMCEELEDSDDDDYEICRAFFRFLNPTMDELEVESAWVESICNK